MGNIDKKVWLSLLAVALLAIISMAFFFPDNVEGNTLQQHDMQQGMANGQEGKAFEEATGETTRWTNSLFGGMPNFQISPSYAGSGVLDVVQTVYTLGLPSPSNLLFGMFIGFFILCLCMDMKWYTSLLGAIAWGFSTYFIIIIGAGHIWKFLTLMYIPPTIAGIILCYRGKYLGGTALAALFATMQLHSNHPQMSYYFVLLIAIMVICWLVVAIKQHTIKQWSLATLCVIVAGTLGLLANSSSLYNSYEYSKETIRGRATEIPSANANPAADGASFEYITGWSYGVDETLTLLIPDVKGGASIKPTQGQNYPTNIANTPAVEEMVSDGRLSFEEMNALNALSMQGINQYFGDQPMTNGPVYVGVLVLLLAIIAMFAVENPLKWALFAGIILSLILAWGYHLEPVSRWFVDHFPMYNKFRTVSSILVIAEFCIPLLAVMCLHTILKDPQLFWQRYKKVVYSAGSVLAFFCLLGIVAPSVYGNPITEQETKAFTDSGIFSDPQFSGVLQGISEGRLSLVRADAWRSLIFLLIGVGILWLFLDKKLKFKHSYAVMVGCLALFILIDLYSVNKRYIDSENFVAQSPEAVFEPTAIDRQILKDTAMNYRVMDFNDFGGARDSYFHKSIGGYHAAKLTRYNDLIEHHIMKGKPQAIDMLNAKYVITKDSAGQQVVLPNPNALGNAWFVSDIQYVNDAPTEMDLLGTLDVANKAVADKKFEKTLGKAMPKTAGDTIYETTYAPNKLTYHAKSAKGGLAVFSEVYFPWGWKATIDGKEAPIGRVNYVLRAMQIPAGTHTIEMTFDPESLHVTNTLSIVSLIVICLLCLGAIGFSIKVVLKIGKPSVERVYVDDKKKGSR